MLTKGLLLRYTDKLIRQYGPRSQPHQTPPKYSGQADEHKLVCPPCALWMSSVYGVTTMNEEPLSRNRCQSPDQHNSVRRRSRFTLAHLSQHPNLCQEEICLPSFSAEGCSAFRDCVGYHVRAAAIIFAESGLIGVPWHLDWTIRLSFWPAVFFLLAGPNYQMQS